MKFSIDRLLENKANAREIRDPNLPLESRKYVKLSPDTAPPIVVNRGDYWVLNGHHRVAAAMMRGEHEIEGIFWPPEQVKGN